MFWFIFGIVAVSFTLGAIIGYKFNAWKEYKNYTADCDQH
jgi:hypothetical protein